MISLFKKFSKNHIGLDISPEGITMVFLKKKNGETSLQEHIYRPFQEKVYQNGQIENPEILSEELKSIISECNFDTKETVISVPGSAVFIKKITLPDLPAEELKMIASQEASKHLPFATNELNVDFQILESTRRPGETGKIVDVVLCAISKAVARNYLNAVFGAGLVVNAIDISPFAMIKSLANAELINDVEKTYISVLIDYTSTDINIIQNGMPMFTHSVQVGRKNIIESIANSLTKKKQLVIDMLPEVALIIPGEDMSENADLNRASTAVRGVYSNISEEIRKAIDFFNSDKTEPVEIETVFLGGNGVCVQNIDKYLYNKLKIDTQIFNPFINLSEELHNEENLLSPLNIPSFSTSIGLALKELEN